MTRPGSERPAARRGLASAMLAWTVLVAPAAAAPVADVLERPALRLRDPARASVTSLAQAGDRVIALGERGAVLLSDDQGLTWRQSRVPVSVTLTAAHFIDAQEGWAVGHGGVVLHTRDGGAAWQLQLDGRRIAQLGLEAARQVAGNPAGQRLLARAQQRVDDGPDKPLLDVCFSSRSVGYVVGAYGLMLRTADGGASWEFVGDRLDNEKSLHLNAVRCVGEELTVAGEQGLLVRSTDGGANFNTLIVPYRGSFFGVLNAPGSLVVAGLRGNAYRSPDGGTSWQRLDLGTTATITSAADQGNGRWLLASQAGDIHLSDDQGNSFSRLPLAAETRVSAALLLKDSHVLVGSPSGLFRLQPTPSPAIRR